MFDRTISPEDLARLKAAREEADRRYNEALTALDRSVPRPPETPHAPSGPDDHQVTPLNEAWKLLPDTRNRTGWRGRLPSPVLRIVAPYLERQQAFNARLVDHVNRSIPVGRETQQAVAGTIAALQEQADAVAAFASHLIVFLQQVTPYVDTKDYEFAGLAKRLTEDARELVDLLDHRTVGVSGALSGAVDEMLKRWESVAARAERAEARAASVADALATSQADVQGSLGTAQQAAQTARREVSRAIERLAALESRRQPTATAAPPSAETAPPAAATGAPTDRPGGAAIMGGLQQAAATPADAYKYVGFEDRFRGARDEIRERLTAYLPYFDGAQDVLDVGCGRGEFLDLLRERGIGARGLDLNHEMVEACRARGLQVDEGDAVGLLESLPDASLGGLIAAQVVEHLQPDYLLAFLDAAYHKLRPGSAIILETVNPACWFAFFQSYIRDITHVRPLHPDTLTYFLGASGFQGVSVRYSAPYPEDEKLRRVPDGEPLAQAFNANVDRLNALLFTYLDYAAIGRR